MNQLRLIEIIVIIGLTRRLVFMLACILKADIYICTNKKLLEFFGNAQLLKFFKKLH